MINSFTNTRFSLAKRSLIISRPMADYLLDFVCLSVCVCVGTVSQKLIYGFLQELIAETPDILVTFLFTSFSERPPMLLCDLDIGGEGVSW